MTNIVLLSSILITNITETGWIIPLPEQATNKSSLFVLGKRELETNIYRVDRIGYLRGTNEVEVIKTTTPQPKGEQ